MNTSNYDDYAEWKQWSTELFGTFNVLDSTYYQAEIKKTGLLEKKDLHLLEIGFGNGNFAGWAQSKGFVYAGSELIPDLISRAHDANISAFSSSEKMFAQSGADEVDLVIAFDVLEHLDLGELEAMLISMRQVLRLGGCILARVPSGDSPFGRAVFHGDITHRLSLGSSAVHQLAARCGLQVVSISSPSLPIFGIGISRGIRRGLLILARKLIENIINVVFHESQPKIITSNLVFILRKG